MTQRQEGGRDRRAITEQQLEQIQRLAADIRFGSITLVFHDGRLIQIDRSEKIRVDKKLIETAKSTE